MRICHICKGKEKRGLIPLCNVSFAEVYTLCPKEGRGLFKSLKKELFKLRRAGFSVFAADGELKSAAEALGAYVIGPRRAYLAKLPEAAAEYISASPKTAVISGANAHLALKTAAAVLKTKRYVYLTDCGDALFDEIEKETGAASKRFCGEDGVFVYTDLRNGTFLRDGKKNIGLDAVSLSFGKITSPPLISALLAAGAVSESEIKAKINFSGLDNLQIPIYNM